MCTRSRAPNHTSKHALGRMPRNMTSGMISGHAGQELSCRVAPPQKQILWDSTSEAWLFSACQVCMRHSAVCLDPNSCTIRRFYCLRSELNLWRCKFNPRGLLLKESVLGVRMGMELPRLGKLWKADKAQASTIEWSFQKSGI